MSLSASRTISSLGTMKAVDVEVYWDSGCTDTVSAINWAIIEPGYSGTKTIHVKNTGNAPLTLNMICSDWTPAEAETHITLSWNKEDIVIPPGVVLDTVLTLSVSAAISGITDFSFNIIVEGTG